MILAVDKAEYERMKPQAELVLNEKYGSYLLIKGLLLHYSYTYDDYKEKENAKSA